jgi:hypothetical protein
MAVAMVVVKAAGKVERISGLGIPAAFFTPYFLPSVAFTFGSFVRVNSPFHSVRLSLYPYTP